jgi:hypothetical protein
MEAIVSVICLAISLMMTCPTLVDNLPVRIHLIVTTFHRNVSIGLYDDFKACKYGDMLQVDDNSPRNFGDSISGWWLIVNRWNPFSSARNVPAITEIQSRLA